MSDRLCGRCSKPIGQDEVLSLWDGEDYCARCVESVSTELADYARSHDALEELAPFDRQAHWRDALWMEAAIFAYFAAVFAIMGYRRMGLAGIALGCLVAAGLCVVQGAIQLPAVVRRGRTARPWVRVEQGRVECSRGERRARLFLRSARLQEISWRMGHSHQDLGLRSTLVPRQEVVLLIVPPPQFRWLPFLNERYACGWSEEMRRIWVAFLTLAGVPKIK